MTSSGSYLLAAVSRRVPTSRSGVVVASSRTIRVVPAVVPRCSPEPREVWRRREPRSEPLRPRGGAATLPRALRASASRARGRTASSPRRRREPAADPRRRCRRDAPSDTGCSRRHVDREVIERAVFGLHHGLGRVRRESGATGVELAAKRSPVALPARLTCSFRGGLSRRRVAATPRPRRGYSVESAKYRGHDVDIPWRQRNRISQRRGLRRGRGYKSMSDEPMRRCERQPSMRPIHSACGRPA